MAHKRLLDLCCRAGGASAGYAQAGFTVVGVDIEPQPKYPFKFILADALEWTPKHFHEFDVIAASPHCQGYIGRGDHMRRTDGSDKPQQINDFRTMLEATGKPYIIENVYSARWAMINNPLFGKWLTLLCGSMFGLKTECGAQLQRHRLFETNWQPPITPGCNHHDGPVIGVYGDHANNRKRKTGDHEDRGTRYPVGAAQVAMDIEWMGIKDLSQAIPPKYTQWMGAALLRIL